MMLKLHDPVEGMMYGQAWKGLVIGFSREKAEMNRARVVLEKGIIAPSGELLEEILVEVNYKSPRGPLLAPVKLWTYTIVRRGASEVEIQASWVEVGEREYRFRLWGRKDPLAVVARAGVLYLRPPMPADYHNQRIGASDPAAPYPIVYPIDRDTMPHAATPPCPICAVWVCTNPDCGNFRRSNASRLIIIQQRCGRCHGVQGKFLAVRHPVPEKHLQSALY